MNPSRKSFQCLLLVALILTICSQLVASNGLAVLVDEAPALNGALIEGDLQVNKAVSLTLNSGTEIDGALLTTGTPNILEEGGVVGSIVNGSGSNFPSDKQITVNSGVTVGSIVRRTNALALPAAVSVPSPSGSRYVTINNPSDDIGNPATLRNLTLNGGADSVILPGGTYGDLSLNGGSLILGEAGSANATNYNLQHLNLNASATVEVVGPVVLNLQNGGSYNSDIGDPNHPEWFTLNVASGSVTLNSSSTFYGSINAPNGGVTVNGGCRVEGQTASKYLTINWGGQILYRDMAQAPVGNTPPVVSGISVEAVSGQTLAIPLDAYDADNDPLTYSISAQPAHGSVLINEEMASYTSNVGYTGVDNFSYIANDGQADSLPANVSLTVEAEAPEPTPDVSSDIVSVTRVAPGLNSGTVNGSIQQLNAQNVTVNGGITINGSYLVSGTPNVRLNGNPDFDGVIEGDGAVEPSNHRVTLNGSASLDHVYNRIDPIMLETVSAPSSPSGSRWVSLNNSSQSPGDWSTLRSLTLNSGYGPISVPPGAYDSFTANSHSEFIFGDAASSEPVLYELQRLTLNAQSKLTVVGPVIIRVKNSINLNASCGDAGAINDLRLEVSNGGLTLNGGSSFYGLVFAPNGTVTINGNSELHGRTQSNRLVVNGGLLELGGSNGGGGSQNQAPIANSQTVETDEDTAVSIMLSGSDPDGDPLSFTVTSGPANGTISGSAPNVTYTPNANFYGEDSIQFTVDDGQLTSAVAVVSITVNSVNNAPVFTSSPITSVDEDSPYSYTVTTSDDDTGDTVTVTATTLPAWLSFDGATLSGTPTNDEVGDHTVALVATDLAGESVGQSFTITVNNVNDAPVFTSSPIISVDEDAAYSYTVTTSDEDAGDTVTVTATTLPTWLSFDGTTLLGTPTNDEVGDHTVALVATDLAGESVGQSITITVNNVNDAPVFTSSPIISVDEDAAYSYSVMTNDEDVGDTVIVTATTLPAWLNFDGTTLSGTPTNDEIGDHAVVLTASDLSGANETQAFTITVNNVNDAPVFTSSPIISVDEDAAYSYSVTTNDEDAGDTVTVTATTLPAWLNFDGTSLSGTPTNDEIGDHAVVLTASDLSGASETQSFTITVVNFNDAPIALAAEFETDEEQAITGNLSGSDDDADILTFATAGQPTNGTVSLNPDGSFNYTPDINYFGSDSFTFTVSDATETSAPALVTISVNAVNDAPVALSASFSIAEDVVLSGSLAGTDIDGDALSFFVASAPADGALELNSDGSFSYTPDTDYHGADSFNFTVSDGSLTSEPTTVSLTVTPVNDDPAASIDPFTVQEDTATPITINASDVDGDTLAATINSVSGGTLTGDLLSGYTFTPDENYFGPASFKLVISDGNGGEIPLIEDFTINAVNDAPVADSLAAETNEDTSVAIALTGSDIDGDILTYVIVTAPVNGSLSGSAPNLTYTPSENFNGGDSFTFSVSDGTDASEVATVSIAIIPVNDAPTFTSAPLLEIDEDTLFSYVVTTNDVDTDDVVTVTADVLPSWLSFDGTTLSGTPTNENVGGHAIVLTATDIAGEPATQSFIITVINVNDTPVAIAATFSTDEDVALEGNLTGSDDDGDSLTFAAANQPSHGALAINADGSFTYTPVADYHGPDSFSFTASDATETSSATIVNLTVNPINDLPVAIVEPFTVDEDTATPITINASDVDGDTLAATINSVSGGTLTGDLLSGYNFTPDENYFGPASFELAISDGNGGVVTLVENFAINSVNDAPVADSLSVETDEDTSVAIALTGSDIDGDSLNYAIVTAPANGILGGSAPNLTYTPGENFNGSDVFIVTVSDGTEASVPASVSIAVNPVNDAPTFTSNPILNVDEDIWYRYEPVTNDVDAGDTVTLVASALPAWLSFNGTTLTGTPTNDDVGEHQVELIASDNSGDSAIQSFTITVINTNDVPVADAASFTTDEDVALGGNLTGSDDGGDSLTFAVGTQPGHGALAIYPDGSFTYTPVADYHGPDSFTFTVSDVTETSIAATVTLTVNPINDLPVAAIDPFTVNEDTATPITINASDVDDDTLTTNIISASGGVLTGDLIAGYIFTPDENYFGPASFELVISDGNGGDVTLVETFTINAVNDAPTADPLSVETDEDTPVAITLTGSDIDGDVLTFAIVTAPANGSLGGSAPNLTYTPDENFNGGDSFTFTVNDGTDSSSTTTVTITVDPVNDAPVFTSAPIMSVDEDTAYSYVLTAEDVDTGDLITVSALTLPSWLTFDGTTLSGTPTNDEVGSHDVVLTVTDFNGDSAMQSFTITVNNVNDAPAFTSTPLLSVDEGMPYSYSVSVSDVDVGDVVTVTATSLPGWLSFDGMTLSGVPNSGDVGSYNIILTANDLSGVADVQSFILVVHPVNRAPVVAISGTGSPIDFTVDADQLGRGSIAVSNSDSLLGSQFFVDDVASANQFVQNLAEYLDPSGSKALIYRPDADAGSSELVILLQGLGYTVDVVDSETDSFPLTLDSYDWLILGGAEIDEEALRNFNESGGAIYIELGYYEGLHELTLWNSFLGTFGLGISTSVADNGDWSSESELFDSVLTIPSASGKVLTVSNELNRTHLLSALSEPLFVSFQEDASSITLTLEAEITDDGLPSGSEITYQWEMVSGPQPIYFDPQSGETGVGLLTCEASFFAPGSYEISLSVSDGEFMSSGLTSIVIGERNPAPVAEPLDLFTQEDVPLPILLLGEDPFGEPIVYEIISVPVNGWLEDPSGNVLSAGSVIANGNVTYYPNTGFEGNDGFDFRVSDDLQSSAAQSVSIIVTPVNGAPQITSAPVDSLNIAIGQVVDSTAEIEVTIRDFKRSHPDFEGRIASEKGLVANQLGEDRLPVYAGGLSRTITSAATFDQWFRDVEGINLSTTKTVTLIETEPGSGVFAIDDHSFFPIDGELWGNEGRSHNYHFTLEMHSEFTYQGGETFEFAGDDDLWLYIDDRLVIDLGGVHPTSRGSIDLDTLGLTFGEKYNFDLFFAERHTTGSNFSISTSLAFGSAGKYVYDIVAVDPDGDDLTYSLIEGPEGLSVDPITGRLLWDADEEAIGSHPINIRVTDAFGAYDEQAYKLIVFKNAPPKIEANSEGVLLATGDFQVGATFYDDEFPVHEDLTVEWRQVYGPEILTETVSRTYAERQGVTNLDLAFPEIGTYGFEAKIDDGLSQSVDIQQVRVGVFCDTPTPSGTLAWWSGNNTYIDEISEIPVFPSGDVSFLEGKVNTAFSFSGGQHLLAFKETPVDIGSSEEGFSIDFWARPSVQQDNRDYFSWRDENGTVQASIDQISFGQGFRIRLVDVDGSAHQFDIGGMTNANTWSHVALVYDRPNGRFSWYRDGYYKGSTTIGSFAVNTTGDFYIGGGGDKPYSGLLDEIALYTRPLSGAEIASLYNAGAIGRCPISDNEIPIVDAGADFGISSVEQTVVLSGSVEDDGLPLDSIYVDWALLSGPGIAIFDDNQSLETAVNFSQAGRYLIELSATDGDAVARDVIAIDVGVECSVEAPEGISNWWTGDYNTDDLISSADAGSLRVGYDTGIVGAAFYFNGNSFLEVPAEPSIDLGSSANGFTIEFWANPSVDQDNRNYFAWQSPDGSLQTAIRQISFGKGLRIRLLEESGAVTQFDIGSMTQAGLWAHVALTYDRPTGVFSWFRDGKFLGSRVVGDLDISTSGNLMIGAGWGSSLYHGKLDEVSFYHRALNITEIDSIYSAAYIGKCLPISNEAPIVDAGNDFGVSSDYPEATLFGVVIDDGLPLSNLNVSWNQLAGPGEAVFADATASETTVTFDTDGVYILELSATDGTAVSRDTTRIAVGQPCVYEAPDGLMAWWRGDYSPTEALFSDEILNSRVKYATGKSGGAFSFDSNAFLKAPAGPNIDIGAGDEGFTIEFWANPDVDQDNRNYFAWLSSNGDVQTAIRQGSFGQGFNIHLLDESGAVTDFDIGSMTSAGNWRHIALTYDRATGVFRWYSNGEYLGSRVVGSLDIITSGDLWIGAGWGDSRYDGRLDEISLYSRPLSDGEVESIYQAGEGGKCPSFGNDAPYVAAGPDIGVSGDSPMAHLNGVVTDDGLPLGRIDVQWTQLEGPGTALFDDAYASETTVTFDADGLYILELSASDGSARSEDLIEVVVGDSCVMSAPDGLKAWWPGDYSARDVVTNYDIDLSHASYASGISGGAFSFNDSGFLIAPAQPAIDLGESDQGFTIEFWANPSVNEDNRNYFSWVTPDGGVLMAFRQVNFGKAFSGRFVTTDGAVQTIDFGSNLTNANEWRHIAFTYDKEEGVFRYYSNGRYRGLIDLGPLDFDFSGDLKIGAGWGDKEYKGRLDEISFYDRPLLGSEVTAIYDAGSAGKCAPDVNSPPQVEAGWNFHVANVGQSASLDGVASDDGLPLNNLEVTWRQVSGAGEALFTDISDPQSSVVFDLPGRYVLELSADDGLARSADIVIVDVETDCSSDILDAAVAWWSGDYVSTDWISGLDAGSIGVNYASGRIGGSFLFDGDSRLTIEQSPQTDLGASADGFTIQFWANPDVNQDNRNYFTWLSPTGDLQTAIRQVSFGQGFRVRLLDEAGTVNQFDFGSMTLAGQWRHITFTYDRASGLFSWYRNGAFVGSRDVGVLDIETSGNLIIGAGWESSNYDGRLDDLILYDRPLSETEIADIYASGGFGLCLPPPINAAPTVQITSAPVELTIDSFGLATGIWQSQALDDGLPEPASLSYAWTVSEGPGTPTIVSPSSSTTEISFDQEGEYRISITVSDGNLSTTVSDTIIVLPKPNEIPVINSLEAASTTAAVGESIALSALISDDGLPNGETLTYIWRKAGSSNTAVFNPEGPQTLASLEGSPIAAQSVIGEVRFTQAGEYIVELVAEETNGLSAVASVNVSIYAPPNVALTSPVDGAIYYSTNTVTLQANATATNASITEVEFFQQDSNGVETSLGKGNLIPQTITYRLQIPASSLPLNEYVNIFVRVTDSVGRTADSASVQIVSADASATPPDCFITSPNGGEEVTAPADIIGTVASSILNQYTLEHRLKGSSNWVQFAVGTESVDDGTLGSFDPTLLRNGIYDLRLTATDLLGRSISDTVSVVVDTGMKIGHFTLAFEDLNIPVSGIPVQLLRTYDSRGALQGDFGPGWDLGIRTVQVYENRTIGEEWYLDVTSGGLGGKWVFMPLRPVVVSVVLGDDQVEQFEAYTEPQGTILGPEPTAAVLKFRPINGSVGSFTTIDGEIGYSMVDEGGGLYYVDDFGNGPLDPSRYIYTSPDGTKLEIQEILGLRKVTDRNQNILTITESGITHNSGKSIAFTRDGAGRITEITDPDGGVLRYTYDGQGRLSRFTDREGTDAQSPLYGLYTEFRYENANFPNHLTSIIDPRGIEAIASEYDGDGRLIAQKDADGNEIGFVHDIPNRKETITDRLGTVTVHEYDLQGNVVATTTVDPNNPDGPGLTTTYEYDANRNETRIVDPLGNVTEMAYDLATNNLLTETQYVKGGDGNPVAMTTTYTYDSFSNPLTITDAEGKVTDFDYDPATGDLLTMTDAEDNPTTFTYDGAGNLKTMTDAEGNVTTNIYNGSGYVTLTQVRDADGVLLSSSTFTYDGRGNQTSQSQRRTLYDQQGNVLGTENVTTQYAYDREDRVIRTTFHDGTFTTTTYNDFGQVATQTDQENETTYMFYDDRGNLTRAAYPDNTEERTYYDLENRRVAMTDRRGYTTYYVYDELGRMIATILPDATTPDPATLDLSDSLALLDNGDLADNPMSETLYDEIGRVAFSFDERGNPTTYEYDPNCGCSGRRGTVTNALNQTTSFAYSLNGNQLSVTDANLHTTQFEYDDLNRPTRTTFHDNTFTETVYDELGRRSATIDQEGKRTEYVYDGLGRLITVMQPDPDAANAFIETHYGYDELGNQISQTDAEGRTTYYQYDSLGRRVARTLPEGQTETYTYYNDGALKTRTDFNGYTTTYEYDKLNRMTASIADPTHPSLELPHAAARIDYVYTDSGQRRSATVTNADGVVLDYQEWLYDERDRLTDHLTPRGDLSYTYDASSNLKSVDSGNVNGVELAYDYDVLNRLETVYDAGAAQPALEHDYDYDDVGNLHSLSYANGVTHTWTYNSLNRLTNLVQSSGSGTLYGYTYELRDSGHRSRQTETSGRVVDYTYDNLYRLTSQTIRSDPYAVNGVSSWTYDDVGNRLTQTSTLPDIAAQNETYSDNDWLDGTIYDDNGNTTLEDGNTDVYDFMNRLVRRTTSGGDVIDITYDADGNRITKLAPAGVTHYLVDMNNLTGYAQVFEELDSTLTTERVYTYGLDLIAQHQLMPVGAPTGWETSYYLYDGLGTVRALAGENGLISDAYTYDAWGNLINVQGLTPNSYLFTGEQWDQDLGMYFLRARYMNPETGRFHTLDTYEGRNVDPQTLHKYLYVHANPVMYIDPGGLYTQSFGYAVEEQIELEYGASFNVATGVTFGGWSRLGAPGSFAHMLKPDILDHNRKKWMEIKPISLRGLAGGAAAYTLYSIATGIYGFSPDSVWQPSNPLLVAGTFVWVKNIDGILFYTDRQEIYEEVAVGVSIYALTKAYNALKNLRIASRLSPTLAARYGTTVARTAAMAASRATIGMASLLFGVNKGRF